MATCKGCGVMVDVDAVQARPFKVCPVCGKPLDPGAAAAATYDSEAAKAQAVADAAAMSSSPVDTTPPATTPTP